VDLNLINNLRYQVMLREENPLHLKEEMDKTFKGSDPGVSWIPRSQWAVAGR